MSTYATSTNGNGAHAPAAQSWEPESPFLSDPSAMTATTSAPAAIPSAYGPSVQRESPFVSEYAAESEGDGPRSQLFAELVSELEDTEFSEALEDLVNEATAVAEDRFAAEAADPSTRRQDAERAVRAYLQPIGRVAEETLDRVSEQLAGVDLTSASDAEVDTLLERFAPPAHDLSPVADQFFGGLLKKAKGAIKAVKKVTSFLPHNLILNKLKALVRPLLEKVLRSALNRVPVSLRPIAKQLAKRFLGASITEAGEMEQGEIEESASVDPAQLEHELDTELAGYALDGESFEEEAAMERAVADESGEAGDPLGELTRCRRRFARRITRMQPSEDVQPVVEEFIPAILAALKLGIGIIGRPKVVKYLAGLVSNLIKKYIGEEQATALSGALVDAGLRTVSLEVEGETIPVAGFALGATVEDTVSRLVQDTPESAWESEAMLAAYTFEAFQQAASAHFPDSEIRDELHEAANTSGVWAAMPELSSHKAYKKYSRVLDITITPQAAASVKTFGGVPLAAFLMDRMGVSAKQPLQARAHLYEAISGTTLGLIALHEKGVAGLGSAGRASRSLIQPLTPEAASALFGEPALARRADAPHLARRGRIGVGQRFYFLEIAGARVRMAPRTGVRGTRPARSSQPRLILDLLRREIRVCLFFSEMDAQKISAQLRQKASVTSLLATIKGMFGAMFKQLSSDPRGAVKIVHETAPTESHESSFVAMLKKTIGGALGEKAQEWVLDALRRELGSQYEKLTVEMERATANEADGVTLQLSLQVPVLEKLRALYKPTGWFGIVGVVKSLRKARITAYRLRLQPGFTAR